MLEYKKDGWKALLALAPTLILMAVFTFYPIINTLVTAFMEGYTFNVWQDTLYAKGWFQNFGKHIASGSYDEYGNLISEDTYFIGIGFGNFVAVFKDPLFWRALRNTSIMVFVTVPITVIIALLISVALNGIKKLQGFFQTIYFLPYVTNTIALGLVFTALFSSKSGLINSILLSLGLNAIPWVRALGETPPTELAAFFVLMIYSIWNGLAFKIMVFLSGMQSIDKQYYQAAQIDATPRKRVFSRITVPLLSPMIAYITITSFIGAFKIYSSVISLFRGRYGPASNPNMLITMVGYTYDALKNMSTRGELARASASALILFAIIMVITLVQLYVSKKRVHY